MNKLNPYEVEKNLREVTDLVGMPIDSGIFRSCVILNSLGYKTRQSCEGHEESYNTYPWIDLIWDADTTPEYYESSAKFFYENLFQDLKQFYKNRNTKYNQQITIEYFSSKKFNVRLSQMQNLKCYRNKRKEKLKEYLNEINDFCEFLNKKYNIYSS